MNKSEPFCKRKKTNKLIVITFILIALAIILPRYSPYHKGDDSIEMEQAIKHDLIRVDSPKMMDVVDGEIKVSGEARGYWFFEASFPIELIDEEGNQLMESYATAQGDWMTEEFVPFEADLEFDAPKSGLGTLILRRDNPSGLPENEDSIGIPVQFKEKNNYVIEEFAHNLQIPWDMAFTSDDRVLVTERPGRLRVIENGVLDPNPLHKFPEVSTKGEEGLMSVELDPDYEENKWIYVSLAYLKDDEMKVKVVRFTDAGNHLEEETVIIDDLPAARFHAGCRLAFGPDGKLYITVGDALDRKDAQKLGSLAGKLLRINKDGSIPADNPFENSPIWSYGHRNSQGIDWNRESGELYSSEHGPSVFDGPPGGDEVNRIIKGGNYGWPLVSHDKTMEGTIPPIIQYTPAEPPGSLIVYSGKRFPWLKNNLFVGSLKGEGLLRIVVDENDPNKVISSEKLFNREYGRIRTVIEGPDGSIYFTTSNRDGRGRVHQRDDRIIRLK